MLVLAVDLDEQVILVENRESILADGLIDAKRGQFELVVLDEEFAGGRLQGRGQSTRGSGGSRGEWPAEAAQALPLRSARMKMTRTIGLRGRSGEYDGGKRVAREEER